MATANLEYEFSFSDGTTTKVTFGPFAPTAGAVTSIKSKISDFNTGDYQNNIVNSNGSPAINSPITAATVVTQETTVFNLSENLLEEAEKNG